MIAVPFIARFTAIRAGVGYRSKQAQRLAETRRLACRRPRKLEDPEVHQYVREKIEKRWSPDQIAGRVRRDFPRSRKRWLSRQTIYDWIHHQAPEWRPLLRRGGKPPEKRGKLTDCVRIDGRSEVINRRRRYGDWEGDTMVGKGRRSALLTLVERKSGYACIGRVDSMKSDMTMCVAKRRMKDLPPALRRSVTFDNGKEFAEHAILTKYLALEVYFAKPYASWQRGTNENTNGLLRQFFPKGTDFTQVSHHEVARVEQLLNERPRRRLDNRTPAEILAPRMCCN
ncbi:MAG: IS30 family transposase [Planctomycetes bacterium]|nr:IS30 family transposase [Planctomycetota bacterium]